MGPRKISVLISLVFSKLHKITLVASPLGQFCETLKTREKLNTNFTRPHAIGNVLFYTHRSMSLFVKGKSAAA